MITATAKPVGTTIMGDSPAAIQLTITADETVRKITRTDANGTAELIPNGANFMTTNYPGVGPWVVTDDAAALGPITYTVIGDSSSRAVSFDNSAPPLDRPVLIGKPWNTSAGWQTVDQITEYSGRRASGTTVHEVINADPLPTWGTPRRRRGSLGIWCRDYAQARAAESLVSTGLWMIRQPTAGLDIVGFTIDTELTPVHKAGGSSHWVLTLEYIERPQPVIGRFL